MKRGSLEERRQQRLKARHMAQGSKISEAWKLKMLDVKEERREIFKDLKKLPLKKLRALHQAAQQAFQKAG